MDQRHAGFLVDPNAVIVRSAMLQTASIAEDTSASSRASPLEAPVRKPAMPHISRALSFELSVAASFDLHNVIVENAMPSVGPYLGAARRSAAAS